MRELVNEISSLCPIRIKLGRELTTVQTGEGEVVVAYPSSEEELLNLLLLLSKKGVAHRMVGNGSNCIIADEGIDEILIKLNFKVGYSVVNQTVTVAADYPMMRLCRAMVNESLSGIEFMAGIPGNVGGGVTMNAGAHGGEIKDCLLSATVVKNNQVVEIPASEMEFSYRHSRIQDSSDIVIGATFQLNYRPPTEISSKIQNCLELRKRTQPLQHPSFGSVFRNFPEIQAWELIDSCNLRGHQIGGCQISEMHPNWIINPNKTGKSSEVIRLMELCCEEVAKKGYQLNSEVKRLGC